MKARTWTLAAALLLVGVPGRPQLEAQSLAGRAGGHRPGTPRIALTNDRIQVSYREVEDSVEFRLELRDKDYPSIYVDVNQDGRAEDHVDVAYGLTNDLRACTQYFIRESAWTGCGGFRSDAAVTVASAIKNGARTHEVRWLIPKGELSESGDSARVVFAVWSETARQWFYYPTESFSGALPLRFGEELAALRIAAAPARSQVFLDDTLLGTASVDGSFAANGLPAGAHRLRLTAAGYRRWSEEVTLSAGKTLEVEARLPPEVAQLTVLTQPGAAQVYLDDQFKGVSSNEGRLVIGDLPPRSYRLRLTLIGYKEWTQEFELSAGESKSVEAKLETAGPKPLELAELEQALKNGVSNTRVTVLVKQFGVDFALTDEVEQRLRAAGANSDLLLAITKAKK